MSKIILDDANLKKAMRHLARVDPGFARVLKDVGHPVRRLVRVRIGPLADRSLKPGEWRSLTQAEVRALETAVAQSAPK